MGMGMAANMPYSSSRAMVPVNGFGYDHRLTGPYGSRPYGSGPAICSGYGSFDNGMIVEEDFGDGYGYAYGRSRRGSHKSSSKYKYYHSSKPATNCTVM